MEVIICESHPLSVSLRKNQGNIMAAMKHFVDTNSLVTRCCRRASNEELEGESFLGDLEILGEVVVKMKESYLSLI